MSPAAASNSTESYLEAFEENVEGKSMRDKLQNIVVTSSMCLSGLLMIGHLLRRKSVWLRALHLPSSVVGGLVGWILFAVVGLFGEDAEALADEWFSVGWDVLPGYCTNVVFCCLFLGTPVPQAREVLQSPRREHLLYGLVVVMGQYVVAAALTGIFIFADPALPAPFATIMPCAAPRNCSAQFCAISAQLARNSGVLLADAPSPHLSQVRLRRRPRRRRGDGASVRRRLLQLPGRLPARAAGGDGRHVSGRDLRRRAGQPRAARG